MVREKIQNLPSNTPDLAPIWNGGDELLLQLASMK